MGKKWELKIVSLFMVFAICILMTPPITTNAQEIALNEITPREISYKPTQKCPKRVVDRTFSQNLSKTYSYYYFDTSDYEEFSLTVAPFCGNMYVEVLDYYSDEVLYTMYCYNDITNNIHGPLYGRTVYLRFTGTSPIGAEYLMELFE